MFTKLKRGLCLLLVCCLLLTLVPLSAMAGDTVYAEIVPMAVTPPATLCEIFPDNTLPQLLARTMGLPGHHTVVTQEDLNRVTTFSGHGYRPPIRDLQGIQFLHNLVELDLRSNQITDISLLSNLHSLEVLRLNANQISDIRPLAGLTNLRRLELDGNPISNFQPLAGLHNLTWLSLRFTQIQNLNPLSGLTNLQLLGLESNQISNIQPLSGLINLEELCLTRNQVSDIEPLRSLVNLENLRLGQNQISDLRPLSGLNRLQAVGLYLQQVTLSTVAVVEGSLVVENAIRCPNGTHVAVNDVSNNGRYETPNVRWERLSSSVTHVTYSFRQHVPVGIWNEWFDGTVTIPLTDTPFTDVNRGHWFNSAVAFVFNEGVMTGTTATTFSPADPLTRAQVARMLWNMAGQPPVAFSPIFTDVPATAPDWYRDAVIWAGTNGIVLGYQGRFNSHENITREQFAIMMFRYAQFTGQNTTVPGNFNLNQFTDQGAISEWALRYVRWAVYNGLITGTPDARIAPQGTADRAEAATILMRFMQRFSA